jgi:hypothetical protein
MINLFIWLGIVALVAYGLIKLDMELEKWDMESTNKTMKKENVHENSKKAK